MLGGRESVYRAGRGGGRKQAVGALYLLAYFMIQLCNALVGPILSQRGQNMTKSIRSKEK